MFIFLDNLFDYQLKPIVIQESLDTKIHVEPPLNPKPLHEVKTNWIDTYCKKQPKERVIWDSKVYSEWKEFTKKPMFEQVEDMMDAVSFICLFTLNR